MHDNLNITFVTHIMQIKYRKRENVCASRNGWPANVYKEILGSFVNVEDLVPE